MPAVEIEDLYCQFCGKRGLLIADQLGCCTDCGSRNIIPVALMSADERSKIEDQD